MNTLIEFEKQGIIDTDKLYKVLESCKTMEQLQSAYRYYELWWKKYIDQIKASIQSSFYHRHLRAIVIYDGVFKRINNSLLCQEKTI